MRFLVVDDEPLVLKDIVETLEGVVTGAEISYFTEPKSALSFAKAHSIDIAFLDIELGPTNGLLLAKQLKDLQPEVHIIFATCHEQYAVEAFSIHATGYILKPVMPDDIKREMTFIYRSAPTEKTMRVQTFGGFSVYVDNQMLKFGRSKAKELLAVLIDRRGADVTTREACAVLWEDSPYNIAQKNYFYQILRDLRHTLRNAGVENILIRSRNSLAIDSACLDCDSYRFMAGDPQAINSYRHDYMSCYSWAEFTLGLMDQRLDRYND